MKYWIALAVCGCAVSAAQTPQFEVASMRLSVKRPVPGGRNGGGLGCPQSKRVDAGRVEFECSNLSNLMAYAFRISPARIVGPDWMSSLDAPRFDVAAKLPDGASERQAPEMLQALLAERFKLITHRGTRTQTLYALAVAKGGLNDGDRRPGK